MAAIYLFWEGFAYVAQADLNPPTSSPWEPECATRPGFAQQIKQQKSAVSVPEVRSQEQAVNRASSFSGLKEDVWGPFPCLW